MRHVFLLIFFKYNLKPFGSIHKLHVVGDGRFSLQFFYEITELVTENQSGTNYVTRSRIENLFYHLYDRFT